MLYYACKSFNYKMELIKIFITFKYITVAAVVLYYLHGIKKKKE